MEHKELGIAVVGAGRIGTLRASLAATHPAVRFLAISDLDADRARTLAGKVGAQFSSNDNLEAISRPEVDAVIVSTSEHDHTLPVLQALERGKPVLVEKPIALNLEDAARIRTAAADHGSTVHVGYSRRFHRHFLIAKEQIRLGRLGRLLGASGRVFNSRAQAFQILKRSPTATPVLDVLTYYVDLICWFFAGNPPVEVVARGQGGIFKEAGYGANDVTWAILTMADGAVVSLGVDYALPEKYPSLGQSHRVEILGAEGVLIFDDDHKDQIFYTDRGMPHGYVPGHKINLAFLSTASAGDWALGDFWGPLADETRAWLNQLSMGRPCVLATAEEASRTLAVTLAIEEAVRTRKEIILSGV
jgi:predicted dehydrogenase